MNIAEYCIKKPTVTLSFAVAMLLAGIIGYFRLGRLEDPEFTIKVAQVITVYPGATAEEVANRVTDPLETAIQQMGQLKEVTSTSYPGKSIIQVEMKDKYDASSLPQVWDELRRKVNDAAPSLPSGCSAPTVIDDYADVFGVVYAIYGDGFTYADRPPRRPAGDRLVRDVAREDGEPRHHAGDDKGRRLWAERGLRRRQDQD